MMIIPTLISAIGSGLGALGQLGSASSYARMAEINYGIDTSNATLARSSSMDQLRLGRIGIGMERGASRTNLTLALADADASARNADRLRQFAETKSAAGRKAIQRNLTVFDEFRSKQIAATSASGVVLSGSPLAVMAESASQFALQLQDQQDEANYQRQDIFARASMAESAGILGAAKARADYGMSQRGAALSMAANRLGRIGAQTAYQSAIQQAEMRRFSGMDAAQGASMSALGSIMSGIGGAIQQTSISNYLGMDIPQSYAKPAGSGIFRT